MKPEELTIFELLRTYDDVMDEVRRRDVVRSRNSPISDLAEVLFCRVFGWTREGISVAGHDAKDGSGVRYQIKARRIGKGSGSRQLSAMRNLECNPFEMLAGVLFNPDFSVHRAAIIPVDVVKSRATWSKHTNSHKFFLKDAVWSESSVMDVTSRLQAFAQTLS